MSKIVSNIPLDFTAKKDAFEYQTQAFMAIKDLDYSAIFHEQGLGKTKIAIDLILYWLQERDIDTVVVVTKKQLINNWEQEVINHTHLRTRVLSSNRTSNFYVFNSPSKVMLTNFETVLSELERFKLFLKSRNVAVIIDESTKLKNPDAKITKAFFELTDLFKIRTIMTGTPVANRPYDIWSQIFFLDKGQSLGTDFKEFKKSTDLSNKLAYDKSERENFESELSAIFSKISDFCVRETKETAGIKLPKKEYITKRTPFEDQQRQLYNKIMHEMQTEIQKDGQMILDDESASLKRILRLVQVASNPRLVDERYNKVSCKENVLDDLIKDIEGKGEKCIVWSNFIHNIDWLSKKYSNLNAVKIHGNMDMTSRNKSVEQFKSNENCKILFATPQSSKEGLTLTVANHVIFYDRGFNLDDYLQAQDRIHRISQTRKCFVYNIIADNSIDEWVDRLIEAKYHAALLTQGDIAKDDYESLADYSYGEMIKEILNVWENENDY
ncbi:DEAD/DEAH box helicase [Anaerovoracaceae bacterium SGI.174]